MSNQVISNIVRIKTKLSYLPQCLVPFMKTDYLNSSRSNAGWFHYPVGAPRRYLSTSSKLCFPLPPADEVRVRDFEATVARRPPITHEVHARDRDNPDMVKVVYTKFWSKARIEVPAIPEGEQWQVGYIQAVKSSHITNRYGDAGLLQVEIPELSSGDFPMIGDSDGKSHPWFNNTVSMYTKKGPVRSQQVVVHLEDYPKSYVYLNSRSILSRHVSGLQRVCETIKLYSLFGSNSRILPPQVEKEPLSFLARNIEFCTWLVIRCVHTGEYHILRSVEWEVSLFMSYDITKPEKERIEFMTGDGIQKNPVVALEHHTDIPDCVFGPPIANEAYYQVWKPTNPRSSAILISPPRWKPDFKL